jgi:hypothetical protein
MLQNLPPKTHEVSLVKGFATLRLWITATFPRLHFSKINYRAHSSPTKNTRLNAGCLHTKAYINWLTLTALNTSKDSLQWQSTKGLTQFVTRSHDLETERSLEHRRSGESRWNQSTIISSQWALRSQLYIQFSSQRNNQPATNCVYGKTVQQFTLIFTD